MQTVVPYYSTSLCKSKGFYEKFMNIFGAEIATGINALAMITVVILSFEIATGGNLVSLHYA